MKNKEKWAAIGELSAKYRARNQEPPRLFKRLYRNTQGRQTPRKTQEKLMNIALSEMDRLNNTISDFLAYSALNLLK